MERRELFTSFLSSFNGKQKEKKEAVVIRPPYYEQRDSFNKGCLDCERPCDAFCEENIIVMMEDGTPSLDFSRGGCTYCDACALHCPNGILEVENKQVIDVTIEINMLMCISWNNTMCYSCKEPCMEDAIEFIGLYCPTIKESCTACGFCVARCPTNAIEIRSKEHAG
jgi:ferredoxin-type protein NapF